MGLLTRNEDVFLLSRGEITHSRNISLSEKRTTDDCPVFLDLELRSEASRIKVEVEWNKISKKRRELGDVADFVLSCAGGARLGDTLSIRFPVSPVLLTDPDFALTAAVSFQLSGSARGAELGFGSEAGLEFTTPATIKPTASHIATAWKFDGPRREAPYIELRLHLASAAPFKIRVARVFAGYDYDPYVFNPFFEYLAHLFGRPTFDGGADVLQEFERQARAACKLNRYRGMQAFIKPFLVMREGSPRFPMLVGTPNSISWYAIEPSHGCEMYAAQGWIRPGDVALDCGAHAGQMSVLFGLVGGPAGKVVAFEPFPQNYFQVESQAALNGLPNLASARAGVGPVKTSIGLSILGQMTAADSAALNNSDEIETAIVPLDDYIDLKPTFIKLDVEGAEVGALAGAQKLIENLKPRIFTELHTTLLERFGHTPKDFFDLLPPSIYKVMYQIEGLDTSWVPYDPADIGRVTRPGLVYAVPR